MRTLYHYRYSPFSRRTRLALAHKGLECELREGRDDPAHIEQARRLVPVRTLPVLVDDGRAMGDSTAIAHWLDVAYPRAPALWPAGGDAADALQVAALVDVVLNNVIDVGTRYWPLRGDAAWESVKAEMLGRARQAADALATRAAALAGRSTIAKSGWSAADMWLLTTVMWFESMPPRAATSKNIEQILTLGFQLPAGLSRWADAHRGRSDVGALT
jgi:glutathione S-transferase